MPTFNERKNTLQDSFSKQLDKTFDQYANHVAGLPNDYATQLTKLNSITTQTTQLQTDVDQGIINLKRTIDQTNEDIENYKTQNKNLESTTSPEDLDATSKRMLDDSIYEYNNKRILFWIKLTVILLIIIDCVYIDNVPQQLFIIIGATMILSIIYFAYKSYTSKG